MAARIIDGKAVAAAVRERVAVEVAAFAAETGRTPGLATVLVGDDPASEIYVAQQAPRLRGGRDALGPPRARRRRPARTSCWSWSATWATTTTSTASSSSCRCPSRSTRTRSSRRSTRPRTSTASPRSTPGCSPTARPGLVPCTPAGVMELLRHEGVELEGAEAVVVGRSKLVGVPVARLLLAGERDGDRLPLAHPRPRRGLPPRRRPRRRGRGRRGCSAPTRSSRAPW